MNEIEPFSTKAELVSAIDNGGRFFNIFSQANDSIVTRGELAKAAGTWASDLNAFLFLELATVGLSEMDKHAVIDMLEPGLRSSYREKNPRRLVPVNVDTQCEPGEAIMTEGKIKHCGDKTKFSGFIYTPLMVGQVTTFIMTPIFDAFDVYHLTGPDQPDSAAVIAVPLNSDLQDGQQIRFGGYIRDLEFEQESDRTHKYYLEAMYFTRIG
ncbi:MAG: hypothetical protein AAGG48_25955 [Planctomycetota bacterium]